MKEVRSVMRAFALLFISLSFAVSAPAALGATTTGGTDPSDPQQSSSGSTASSGGASYGVDPDAPPRVLVPGMRAKRMGNGYAAAPAGAPIAVQEAIFAANEIVGKPYVYGGGHASFKDSGYDCSGTVSYALNGGGWLDSPLPSGSLMTWAAKGTGRWVSVYANGGHAWMKIAGLRLDTSSAGERVSSGEGPRWRKNVRGGAGFVVRHPAGF
jgi:cell wall-associated NlpC family hydrolase